MYSCTYIVLLMLSVISNKMHAQLYAVPVHRASVQRTTYNVSPASYHVISSPSSSPFFDFLSQFADDACALASPRTLLVPHLDDTCL